MPAAQNSIPFKRLLSLDVMRGFIMILLAGESCLVYQSLSDLAPSGFASILIAQFFHHPWHGLHFWDLVQPAFMMMAGAAMYISWYFKKQKGISWEHNFKHIVIRGLKLFACGVGLHCVYAGKLVWELWNVLTQLSVTTIIAYLVIQKPVWFQVVFSAGLLIFTDFLYRFIAMPGYDQPFVSGHNFGNLMDMVLMGKINSDGWVAINVIPTAAHTIWGVLAGTLLMSEQPAAVKIKSLLLSALLCLILGYGLDAMNVTPIIKRISTSSFALASGGWVLVIFAFLYWFLDVKRNTQYTWIFTVVGMNAIFIYLFFETVGAQWMNGVTAIFVKGILNFTGADIKIVAVISAITTLVLEWALCYWLNAKKIFFKL